MFLKYLFCVFLIIQVVTPKVIPRSHKGHVGSQEEYDEYIAGFNDLLNEVDLEADVLQFLETTIVTDPDAISEEKLNATRAKLHEMQDIAENTWGTPGIECIVKETDAITQIVVDMLNGVEVCPRQPYQELGRCSSLAVDGRQDSTNDLNRVTSAWKSCEDKDVKCRIEVVEMADSLLFKDFFSIAMMHDCVLKLKEDVKNMMVCVRNNGVIFDSDIESMIQRVNQCWEGLN